MGAQEAQVLGCFKTQDKGGFYLEKHTVKPEWCVKAGGGHDKGNPSPNRQRSFDLPYLPMPPLRPRAGLGVETTSTKAIGAPLLPLGQDKESGDQK